MLDKHMLNMLSSENKDIIIIIIIVCPNNDPGVTLTYFTARSNLVT